jgi:putative ATPase
MADAFDAQFIAMSAVLGGVKDIREAVERGARRAGAGAAHGRLRRRGAPLQQEPAGRRSCRTSSRGLLTFIGATTENPSFEVNSALLSRATVHVLKSLDDADLRVLLGRAARLLGAPPMTAAAETRLVAYADGDARRLLNAYENLVATARDAAEIDEKLLEQALGEQLRRYDKGGEQFYDTISALHKAVRGSDPDASLTGSCA